MQTNLGDLVLGIFEGVFDRFDGGGLGRAIVRLGGVLGRGKRLNCTDFLMFGSPLGEKKNIPAVTAAT